MKYRGTEHQLCEDFRGHAESRGWLFYPETGNWDILLVRQGLQIGVQAKTSPTVHVIHQALPVEARTWVSRQQTLVRRCRVGPHFRTVLTPIDSNFVDVARLLGIWVFGNRNYGHDLLERPQDFECFRWQPEKLHMLPEVLPEVLAGVPSPIQLTPWKQKALKLLARARIRGATSRDAHELKINLRLFIDRHWLRILGREGKLTLWGLDPLPSRQRPDQQHPREFEHYVEAESIRCAIA